MDQQQQINKELSSINLLLQDTDFALRMAIHQDAAYHTSQGQDPPPFIREDEMNGILPKSAREERIATSLAPFYAVECGIGMLLETTGGTPVSWLEKIVNGTAGPDELFLLDRFANATWKAGQPFRGLERIRRPNFQVANFLPAEEIQKDTDQILAAAGKLLDALQDAKKATKQEQWEAIGQLEKDNDFAAEMAQHIETSYFLSQQQPAPPFPNKEDTSIMQKSIREEKIATNIAGFYALECGLSWLAYTRRRPPTETLRSIMDATIGADEKLLFARLANATWKAGQPFRGLNRIGRDNFTPASFLSPEEIEKDHVQIRSAASLLLQSM